MIDLGPHASYILGAYGGVAGLVLVMIGLTAWRTRAVERRIAALEAAAPTPPQH